MLFILLWFIHLCMCFFLTSQFLIKMSKINLPVKRQTVWWLQLFCLIKLRPFRTIICKLAFRSAWLPPSNQHSPRSTNNLFHSDVRHNTEEIRHLSYMVCCTQTGTETHTPSNTYTMSQSSFGPSAGSSVRVTAIYSVPSISTDDTWSLHPPSQTQLSPSDIFTNTKNSSTYFTSKIHIKTQHFNHVLNIGRGIYLIFNNNYYYFILKYAHVHS